MSFSQFWVATVAVVAYVWAAAMTGRCLSTVFTPGWKGPMRMLGQATVAVAVALGQAHVLGAVGLFRRGWLVAVALLVAGGAHLATRQRLKPPPAPLEPRPSPSPISRTLAPLALCVLAGQWATRIAASYRVGITDVDSVQYHLPHAARFAHTGWITRLHFVSASMPENAFHPSDGDLLHAVGMALTGRDVLSPVLNVGFGALLLLAAWCCGRGPTAARVMVIGAAVVLAMPMTALSAGSALNDVAAMAFLLAAVAFLLESSQERGSLVLCGASAGMAIGTKLTVVAPVAVLSIGLAVLQIRRTRSVPIRYFVALASTGSYWFVRNLVAVGNPVPGLGFGPFVRVPGSDVDAYTVLHYARHASAWREWLIPGLATGSTPLWWVVAFVAAAAVALPFLISPTGDARDGKLIVVSTVVVAALAAYVVTPNTAHGPDGVPWQFALNLRYAFPAVLIALVLLPRAVGEERGPLLEIIASLYFVLFVASELAGRTDLPGLRVAVPAWPDRYRWVGLIVALGAAGAWMAAGRLVDLPRRVALVGAVTSIPMLPLAAFVLARSHYETRYSGVMPWSIADQMRNERIAVTGTSQQYEFYGRDLSNRVQFLGRRVQHGGYRLLTSCTDLDGALADGRYDLVVVVDDTPEAKWISELRGPDLVARTKPLSLYRPRWRA